MLLVRVRWHDRNGGGNELSAKLERLIDGYTKCLSGNGINCLVIVYFVRLRDDVGCDCIRGSRVTVASGDKDNTSLSGIGVKLPKSEPN